MSGWKGREVYTIGHSTRSFDELVALLRAFEIAVLVDIRTVPRSRKNPQFNRDVLPAALRARRLRYLHVPELGGLRRARKDSPNGAWRNQSFRGYADHLQTEEFEVGLSKLQAVASERRVALMCAEAVPWRCHRSLVADVLTARGAHVQHITSLTRASPHRVTPFARVQGERVTYPAEEPPEPRAPGEAAAPRKASKPASAEDRLARRPASLPTRPSRAPRQAAKRR